MRYTERHEEELVDRLREVNARIKTMPAPELQDADAMDEDTGLGPDLMPYESGRRDKKAKRVKLSAVRLISREGNWEIEREREKESEIPNTNLED